MSVNLIGPTGKFPQGKCSDDDKGEFSLAIVEEGHVLKMIFGKPIDWLGLEAELCREIGTLMLEFAAERETDNGVN